MVSMKFDGGVQFAKALSALPLEKQRGAKLAMLKRAAEPIRERMEELVVIGDIPPHIVDQISVSVVSKLEDDDFGGMVDLPEGAAAVAIGPTKKHGWYGHFIEFGTAPTDSHPGTPAKPFVRPAFDEKAEAAQRSLQDDIWAHIRNTASRSVTGRGL